VLCPWWWTSSMYFFACDHQKSSWNKNIMMKHHDFHDEISCGHEICVKCQHQKSIKKSRATRPPGAGDVFWPFWPLKVGQWEIPVVFRCPNCEAPETPGLWAQGLPWNFASHHGRQPANFWYLRDLMGFIWIYIIYIYSSPDSSPDPTSATELPSFEAGPVNQQRSGPFLPLPKWKFWAAAILRTPYSCIRCRSRCNLPCPMMSRCISQLGL
jgi:hypothetical protein